MKIRLMINQEIRQFVLLCGAIGGAACILCAVLAPAGMPVCLILTLALTAAFLFFTVKRYERIAQLSGDLERLLNGDDGIEFSKYSEGEFSILENRLSKLVRCLRDQTEELKKDKLLLADSIADISHQIKTPLTSIHLLSIALSKADEGAEDHEGRHKTLADMHAQIDRMDWLVSSLLKLARLDADAVEMSPQEVSLKELIRLAAQPLEIMMELKGQQLEISAQGGVRCDLSWTAEALTNILKNCSESMGEGTLQITAAENPLYAEIIVQDGGRGIDPEDLPHIFERFYRGKHSSGSGAGIGLSLARSILVKQNGTLKAENAPGGGARFTLRLYKGAV